MTSSSVELSGRLRPSWHVGAIVTVVACVVAVIPAVASPSITIQSIDVFIFAILALSLNLLVGYSGLVSMGHAAFFAIGGYSFGIVQHHFGLYSMSGIGLAVIAALSITLAFAALIGFFATRVAQAYFIMLTLAFGQLIYVVIWQWHDVTGGDDGFINIRPPPFFASDLAFFYLALISLALCIYSLHRIVISPFGKTLSAIRDNPIRAAYVGINIRAFRLAAFVMAAGFAGIAGILQAMFHRGMFPNFANFVMSADALVVIVLGGVGYFAGPLVGTAIFKFLSFILPTYTEYWLLVFGILIMGVALLMPDGVMAVMTRWMGETSSRTGKRK
jgi:branched-chain amino acid transport system permease protein